MRKIIISVTFLLIALSGYSQTTNSVLTTMFGKKKTVVDRKPIPYQTVREADVIWAKLLWREVNLEEKYNQRMYFPTTPQDGIYSLIDVFLKGIKEGKIVAFDTDDDEFKVPMTYETVQRRLGQKVDTVDVEQEDGSTKKVFTKTDMRTNEVKRYLVKEIWYFDKQSSTMQKRIIGICPVRVYKKQGIDQTMQQKCFWINYDECRDFLVKHEVYNSRNDALRITYDDLFIKRQFNSIIKKESNVYDNRGINTYATGVDTMIESERITREIFNWEQDLWIY